MLMAGQIMAERCPRCVHRRPGWDTFGVRCNCPDPQLKAAAELSWLYPWHFNPIFCTSLCAHFMAQRH